MLLRASHSGVGSWPFRSAVWHEQVAGAAEPAALPALPTTDAAPEAAVTPAPAADAQRGDAERAAKDAIMRGIDRADAGIEALEQQVGLRGVEVFRI